MGYIIMTDEQGGNKRSQMRNEMRRMYGNRYYDGERNHGGNSYEDGYREGYRDGKDDTEYGWDDDSENYRRARNSRGRYI